MSGLRKFKAIDRIIDIPKFNFIFYGTHQDEKLKINWTFEVIFQTPVKFLTHPVIL